MNASTISNEEFDRRFDEGEDLAGQLDMSTVRHANSRRVNVDFPAWMVEALDEESSRMGITRQALIKVVINEHLKGASRP